MTVQAQAAAQEPEGANRLLVELIKLEQRSDVSWIGLRIDLYGFIHVDTSRLDCTMRLR